MRSLVGPSKRQTYKNNQGCDLPSHIPRDIFWGPIMLGTTTGCLVGITERNQTKLHMEPSHVHDKGMPYR